MLQQIDDWIAAGVLDGEELNAADFQIGASVRLLLTLQDLRPLTVSRAAGWRGARSPTTPATRPRS